jgi:hypothetical protein
VAGGAAAKVSGHENGYLVEPTVLTFDDHFNVKSVMVATHEQPFDLYRDTAKQRRLN